MTQQKHYYVYFIASLSNSALYVGITSNIQKRIHEHKGKFIEGFSKTYNCQKLVYFEVYDDPENATLREKQIKKWARKKKDFLVNKNNPAWNDLYENLF